jgi:hypothetical protein
MDVMLNPNDPMGESKSLKLGECRSERKIVAGSKILNCGLSLRPPMPKTSALSKPQQLAPLNIIVIL